MGLQAEAFGRGDAGFGSTSRMVLEAGLTLALQVTGACHTCCSVIASDGVRRLFDHVSGHSSLSTQEADRWPVTLQLGDCEKAGRVRGGVLTPASAMGPVLIDRLQRHGDCKFTISPAVGHRLDRSGPTDAEPADAASSQSKM